MGNDRIAVVGSGPNGLAAAVTLARAGLSVDVLERNSWTGGGASTREITLPGFRHDLASAVHPMALVSPFFRAFELERRIDLMVPEVSFAHPLRDGLAQGAGHGYRDIDRAAEAIGRDGPAYRALLRPLIDHVDDLTDMVMNPLVRLPRHPRTALAYARRLVETGTPIWNRRFHEPVAPAMLTGCAAHTIGRQPSIPMAGGGLLLSATAHARGWPVPVGGSQAISDAMLDDLRQHGGVVRTGVEVTDLAELDEYDDVVLDVSVPGLLKLAGDRLSPARRAALQRFRSGNGVSKVDFALSGPVPWSDPVVGLAPTVHLGGTRAEIAQAERTVARGLLPQEPYVLLVQPSVVDPTRAPEGKAVLWAYTHVPYDSPADCTEIITRTIERIAPGFRDVVLASKATTAQDFATTVSANFAGGDFASGAVDLRQMLSRPTLSRTPWRTPMSHVYLGSGATSPGPSVHGMSGWHAARTLLADRHLPLPDLAL